MKGLTLRGLEGSSYEVFSFAESNYRLSGHPLVQAADIIHLHWVAQFINYPTFFRLVNKPIVWTLHDMNPFLGGFHYRGDHERNSPAMDKLNKKILGMKSDALRRAEFVSISCPSQWLLDESASNEIFRGFPRYLTRNTLNLDTFRPLPKIVARETLQLPHDQCIFLFVSESLENHRKGLDLLMNGLESLNERKDIFLCTIGDSSEDHLEGISIPIRSLGMTRNDELLATAYSAADAFVLTSREDNLPNVILESLACGTPVLTTPVGGAREIVEPGVTGLLANAVSPIEVQKLLARFLESRSAFQPNEIRNRAVRLFSPRDHAHRLSVLYSDLLKRSGLTLT